MGATTPPERALSEYQKREWHVEDGLPSGNVRTMVQQSNGALLIGTGGGLVSFDGARFTPVQVDSIDDSASEPVNTLLLARNGDLWIGTDDRGIIHRSPRETVNVSEAAGLTQERVRGLYEDRLGVIWAGTQNCVERIVGSRIECLTALGVVPGDVTRPFGSDGHGGMFIITVRGLFHWTSARIVPVALHHPELGSPTAVYTDPHGRVWVGTERGLLRLSRNSGVYNAETVPGAHGPIASLLLDRDDNLWIGSRGNGLCRLSPSGEVTHWTSSDGLSDDTIRSLFEDQEGNLWVGMISGGLSRWRQTLLEPYGRPEGFPEGMAANVLQNPHGGVWLAAWGRGVYHMNRGALRPVPLPGTSPNVPIRALADDRKGGLWIGTWYNGLYHFDGHASKRYLTGTESLSNAVADLLVDRSGVLWVGTYRGLLKYDSGYPEPGREQILLQGKLITSIAETPSGSILVGTTQGLYVLDGGFVSAISRKNGLSNDAVVSVSVDGAGAVWVGTKAGGLDRILDRKAVPLPQGLPRVPIFSVIDDTRGSLWMASSRGVLRVRRGDLHEFSDGSRRILQFTHLGKSDGMRNSECVGIARPPAALAQDGSIWFATAMGFVHTNPTFVERPLPPPSPAITGFTIDRVSQPPSARLIIPAGRNDVDFQFEAIRLSDPSRLQFRCKLEGYDTDWTETRARHMLYKRLPAGHFRFLVSVRDQEGPWSPTTASIEVLQQPFFYQQWWFYVALAIALAGLIVAAFRWRDARARNRLALILEERNRIAREWHDTLMAGFAAISWQLEASRDRLHAPPRDLAESLDLTRDMVKHCQAQARRIIWDLRDNHEPLGLLSQELSRAIATLGPRAELEAEVSIEGEERPLPPVYVHHLVCIGQEAVTNALRHAEPDNLSIRVTYQGDRVYMAIEDNGCGFSPPEPAHAVPGHFGLAVMRERAKKMGGNVTIRSAPGSGTRVLVEVPVPASGESS